MTYIQKYNVVVDNVGKAIHNEAVKLNIQYIMDVHLGRPTRGTKQEALDSIEELISSLKQMKKFTLNTPRVI